MNKNTSVELESATFTFSQDSHCMTDANIETITVDCLSSAGIDYDKDAFFVLRSGESGWAVDDAKGIADLIERCKTMLNISPKDEKDGEKGE